MNYIDEEKLSKKLTESAEKDLENNTIAGASILVAQCGRIIFNECFGFSDKIAGIPLRDDSVFRLASMTKPITAVCALVAEEMGLFSLDDKAKNYFPDVEKMQVGRLENGIVVPDHKPKEELRLYHFLSHTSGFMSNSPLCSVEEAKIPRDAYRSNRAAVDYVINNTCLTLEPTESTGYSAYQAFDFIALIIEDKIGMKYADFMRRYVLDPLEMFETTYNPTDDTWEKLVKMTDRDESGKIKNVDMGKHTFAWFPLEYTCAGAGLVGTKADYFKFAEMLRRGGEYNGKRIISSESVKKMRTPKVKKSAMKNGATDIWGLAVSIRTEGNQNLTPGSYGWSGAYGTHFFIDPKNDITAIYLKNSRYDSGGCGITGQKFERDVTASLKK